MANHQNRTVYRYFEVCPRGFANEVTYYRVAPSQVADVEKRYGGEWKDREFDLGNTSADARWVEPSLRVRNNAVDWNDEYDPWSRSDESE